MIDEERMQAWRASMYVEIDGHKRGVFLDAGLCVICDEQWPCQYVRDYYNKRSQR